MRRPPVEPQPVTAVISAAGVKLKAVPPAPPATPAIVKVLYAVQTLALKVAAVTVICPLVMPLPAPVALPPQYAAP